jgi:hypothetical protein
MPTGSDHQTFAWLSCQHRSVSGSLAETCDDMDLSRRGGQLKNSAEDEEA